MAFLGLPAGIWGLVVAATWMILTGPRPPIPVAVSVIGFACILLLQTTTAGLQWSPYSKLTTEATSSGGTLVSANGVPHQEIQEAQQKLSNEPQYGLPYQRVADGDPGDVLVIGAGTGNDVAIALDEGADNVTAVEIDPRLIDLGRELHPDHPYDDPRVTLVNDDGRAFLEKTDQKFDLILFAHPDSLTLVNGGGGVRLESYLFTKEAIDAARARLNPGGGFAMYNYYREVWLVDRLGRTLSESFGHAPCIDRIGDRLGQSVLSISLDEADQKCGDNNYAVASDAPPPATDDHPFVYVLNRTIPGFYLISIAAMVLISLALVRLFSGGRLRVFPYRDLFFMGAAFLLLETRSVTTFALLFGTTWLVNAFVFAGILVAVLLAVEVTARFRTPPLGIVYTLLGIALAVAFAVPNEWLLGLPYYVRLALACAIAFAPVFLANIAFAKRFAESSSSTDAFAINVLGAMVGGCLEYVALITGYRGLLVLVGVLYFAAFALRPKHALSPPQTDLAVTS
jgi:SAM-dependent methyltransferase